MNPSMERLYKAALQLKGISGQSALAKALNASSQTVHNWEKRGVSQQGLVLAQRVIGCNSVWIETGAGTMSITEVPGILESATEAGIRVPMLSNDASMGGGCDVQLDDVMTGHLTLTPNFVNEAIRPTGKDVLRFIHAYGDSMTPTLNSGDVLLVDTGIIEVKIDGIYVLRAHDRLFVKRVRQRMDGKFEISSDNPTHKTVDILNGEHDVSVIGRVVWAWNGRRM